MIKDHESAAPRDVVGIIGLPLRFQPLDLGFQFAKPGVHVIRQFLGRLVLLGQAIEFGLRSIKGGLIVGRKLHRVRVRSAQAMGVKEIEMDLGPSPTLRLPQGICRAPKFCGHQPIEQRNIFEVTAAILRKEVAQDRAARLRIGLHADKDRAAIRGGNMGFRQQATDRTGITIMRKPLKRRFLPSMILSDRKGHQLIHCQMAVAIEQ